MVKKLSLDIPAPDFELTDTNDQPVRLSSFKGKRPVVLVLNRGFV